MAAPHSYTIDHGEAVPAQGGHIVNNMHRAAAGRPGDGDIGALVTCRGVQRLGGDQGQRPVSGAEDCGLRGNILRIFAQNANKRTYDFFQLFYDHLLQNISPCCVAVAGPDDPPDLLPPGPGIVRLIGDPGHQVALLLEGTFTEAGQTETQTEDSQGDEAVAAAVTSHTPHLADH